MLALVFFKNINSYINRFPTKPSKWMQNERCLGNINLRSTKSTGNRCSFSLAEMMGFDRQRRKLAACDLVRLRLTAVA